MIRTDKGFKVNAREDRFGEHTKMMGVTSNKLYTVNNLTRYDPIQIEPDIKAITANILDTKVSSKDTDGQLTIFEQTGLTPKGGPPLHIHPFQDEMFYVIEGQYLYQVGEDKYEMKAGDTIFLPRNVPHTFVQLTEKGRLIVTFQPSGKMEEFFKKTSEWTSPPIQEEIAKVFEEHDMKVVGPPLKAE